jgi:uncharacterized protein YhbP (UPF0306 family)
VQEPRTSNLSKSLEFSKGVAGVIDEILEEQYLCSIASVAGPGAGVACAATVSTAYYAVLARASLAIWTSQASRHASLWVSSSSVAIAIFDSHQQWGVPHRGLQGFGQARLAPHSARARLAYTNRFPRFIESEWTAEYTFYILDIHIWRCVDESRLGPVAHELVDER